MCLLSWQCSSAANGKSKQGCCCATSCVLSCVPHTLAKQHLDKYKEDVDDDERHCRHTRTQSTRRQLSAGKTRSVRRPTTQESGQHARCMYVIACSSPIVCCLNAPGLGPIPLPPCSCE
jgi:hypothetical protein